MLLVSDVEMCVGSSFSSFEELETKIKAYQCEQFRAACEKARDTRTLEIATKRVSKQVEGSNAACLFFYTLHLEGRVTRMKELGRGGIKGELNILSVTIALQF